MRGVSGAQKCYQFTVFESTESKSSVNDQQGQNGEGRADKDNRIRGRFETRNE